MLNGKKTYLAAIGIIILGIGGFLTGDLTLVEAVRTILEGLGLGAVRIGISKI